MSERSLTIAVAVLIAAAIIGTGFGLANPIVGLGIFILALVVGWKRIPGFWRMLLGGLAGAGLAGVLILGPGLRLAMRIVAIQDPFRTPEFSFGDTLFIIFISAILGATIGLFVSMLAKALGLRPLTAAVSNGAAFMAIIVFNGELRGELFQLGGGIWINGPMFGAVTLLYGYYAERWARRFGNTKAIDALVGVPS